MTSHEVLTDSRRRDVPAADWLHHLRLRDLETILKSAPVALKGPVLELGCGDGVWTQALKQRFPEIVSIDIRPRAVNPDLIIADAQTLPFKSNRFRLVISSNVLEHVSDIDRCLRELDGVTTQDAVMVHTMPTTFWKLLQIVARPVQTIVRRWRRLTRQPASDTLANGHPPSEATSGARRRESRLDRVWRALLPDVHGTARSHCQEFRHFRVGRWRGVFARHRLRVIKVTRLQVHSPYRLFPYRLTWLRESIARLGISSTCAYWSVKDRA